MKKVAEIIKRTNYENEQQVTRILAIQKDTDTDKEVAEIIYKVYTGESETNLECQVEWNLGVKLNKEQAESAQENNMKSWFPIDTDKGVDVVTEGYYIVELDRGGEWYYRVNSEKDLVEVLIKYYINCLDSDVE